MEYERKGNKDDPQFSKYEQWVDRGVIFKDERRADLL